MKNIKIFTVLMLFLLLSGCRASPDNIQSNPSDRLKATNDIGQPMRYVPEYHILPYAGNVQEAFFNGEDITLLISTGYVGLGNEKVEVCRGKFNSLELENVALSLPAREIIQSGCTVGNIAGGLETIYLATGNADVRKDKKEEFRNHLLKVDKDGTVLETFDISGVFGEENQSSPIGRENTPVVAGMEADGEGNIYFFTPAGKDITALSPQGVLLSVIPAGDAVVDMCTAHGKIYAAYFHEGNLTVGELNPSEHKLIPVFKDSEAAFGFSLTEGPEGQLLFTEGGETRAYATDTGKITALLKWLDYNTVSDHIANLKYLADNRILVVDTDSPGMDNARPEYVFLREAAPGENPDAGKETLTIYCSAASNKIKLVTNRFNKTNADYRFELRDYGMGFWGGAEVERLNKELITGEAADIMIFELANPYTMRHPSMEKPAILPYEEYGEMGVFENLYDYMNADPDFHREDYYENIWEAFETDGELYYIPLTFDFDTIIVNPADAEGRTGWTLDELIACVEEKGGRLKIDWQNPQGRSARQSILELCLRTGKWELTEGNIFNRELMRKMLTFAYQAGTEKQEPGDTSGSLQLKVYERSSLGNVQYEWSARCDEWGEYPVNIGYPSEGGSGTLVHTPMLAAINKDCPAPEVAWELLSALLNDENVFLRKDLFREYVNRLKLVDITMYGSVQKGTAEFADRIQELAESTNVASMTLPIEIIIREEAEYYFQEAKPLEEVLDVIANRVSLYLNENK